MTSQIEPTELEAPLQEAEAMSPEHRSNTGQLLVQAVQQRVAETIKPMLEDVQRRMAEIVQNHMRLELQRLALPGQEQVSRPSGEQPGSEEEERRLPESAGVPISLTVTIGRRQAEQALQLVLGSILDSLFSDTVRATVEQQSKKAVQSLVRASRKALPEEDSRSKVQERTEHILDRMVDELFSSSMRGQAERDGEQIVRTLVRGDIPTARREGERALQAFAEQWASVAQKHWEKAVQLLLKAATDASKESFAGKPRDTARRSASDSADEQEIPQTILRSDKRAQDIWRRARDQAAKRDDTGRSADRAGYEALKREYKKKGDRWVRKGVDGQPESRAVRGHNTPSKSTSQPGAAARDKDAKPQQQTGQNRRKGRRPQAQR